MTGGSASARDVVLARVRSALADRPEPPADVDVPAPPALDGDELNDRLDEPVHE